MKHPLYDELLSRKLVIISRGVDTETLVEAAFAMQAVGVRFLESTFDHRLDNAIDENARKISALKKALGDDMHIGAGTVLNVEEARATYDAGGEFVLSPSLRTDVVAETKKLGMLAVPGAMTPTEVCNAWDAGADLVKLFPADDVGMHYITNLRGPFPHIPLLATGGVNPDTIPVFLHAGINAFATGVTVLKRDLLVHRDFGAIAALAKAHIDAIQKA